MMDSTPFTSLKRLLFLPLLAVLGLSGCGPSEPDRTLAADLPLHLEDHVDRAIVSGSAVPANVPQPVAWDFGEAQPGWKVLSAFEKQFELAKLSRTGDALRITLGKTRQKGRKFAMGGVFVEVPGWNRDDWAFVEVRARTSDKVGNIALAFNLADESKADDENHRRFQDYGDRASVMRNGSIQTYSLRADWSGGMWEGKWKQLILYFWAEEPGAIDLLSVTVIPKEAGYADGPTGVRSEIKNRIRRRALYVHAPGRLEYQVRVPARARLDLGFGVLRNDRPVKFRVTAGSHTGASTTLLEEVCAEKKDWVLRSVDLSRWAGRTVRLGLECDCEREGTVALWAAPTLTGVSRAARPNVILYVIDGGAADAMSVYGSNRRTTPNLERLAAEGTVFEWAYSNSSWTVPSVASFMTSIQNSVMGGEGKLSTGVPEQLLTMAEHMHRAGYQTGVMIANPNAGSMSNLQRGVDLMKESWEEFSYSGSENHKESSRFLPRAFWDWREAFPGKPYWVHFQTTDVHDPQERPIPAPFSGLFVSPEELTAWKEWTKKLNKLYESGDYSRTVWKKAGVDRIAYYRIWKGLYDQALAHNDFQLGRLVERLETEGDWGNTLLIVAADHSASSAGVDFGLKMQDQMPPEWSYPMFRPSIGRVPLLFVWPGHIKGGQRIMDPVSLVDILPTILDLLDLPKPEVMMGQSLAPLLLGRPGWEPRPVILDEFYFDADAKVLRGTLEVVDGRWGASLEINTKPPDEDEKKDPEEMKWRRPVPLLLYDLWDDYHCLNSIHEKRPDLVKKYTAFLEERWKVHQTLGRRFTRGAEVKLTSEQLETLRSLGYVR